MKFYSTRGKESNISLAQAIIGGLASDKGLFMPHEIPELEGSDIEKFSHMELNEIAFNVARALFKNSLDDNILEEIINQTFNFKIPLVEVEQNIFSLELFHGPTMAFKDVGARFMARLIPHIFQGEQLNILVATSGDTGAAVAQGFHGVKGVKVWVLYPNGKVSDHQEAQFTTLGDNITALAVNGTFDDCQHMVKSVLADKQVSQELSVTTANSINVARFIPQMFYYFYAWSRFPKELGSPLFSVPCGNFGNLAAGLLARKMGLEIPHFVVSTNMNDVVPQYLNSGIFEPRSSVQTIANAMDVGNPSNFERILHLYNGDLRKMQQNLSAYSFSDQQIRSLIKTVKEKSGYLLDPHGATAYGALKKKIGNNRQAGIFLETAHPAKFVEVIEPILEEKIELPFQLSRNLKKQRQNIELEPMPEQLKNLILS